MMNDEERERVFVVCCALELSSTIKYAHTLIHSQKCIHRFMYGCAASYIVVVSKIKRLVVRTRADAREIYSNVDA
jgi:hypothetical protein